MWFALTQPPYGTSMPQNGRRPQHQKRRSSPALLVVRFTLEHRTYQIAPASLIGATSGD